MSDLFALALLVPLLPLLAAGGVAAYVLSGQAAGDAGEVPTARLVEGAAWLALLILLGLDVLALSAGFCWWGIPAVERAALMGRKTQSMMLARIHSIISSWKHSTCQIECCR